jgi:hypothetical protein
MLRPPAEIAPGFRAAKLLVERIAPGPGAEFGRQRRSGNDVRHLTPRAETPCKSLGDAADGKAFDRGADIARPRWRIAKRQSVEGCEVFAVHERPACLSGAGSRQTADIQTADIMSAPDEFSHHGGADRARPTQNQNAHEPAP